MSRNGSSVCYFSRRFYFIHKIFPIRVSEKGILLNTTVDTINSPFENEPKPLSLIEIILQP